MRVHSFGALLILAAVSGCSNPATVTSIPAPAPTPTVVKHTYNGTASVGDFLTITDNTTAQTISYTNLSNGDTGTVPYTVNANGSYALNDTSGNLITAYGIPGYALVIQAAKAGADHNTPALITAVETGQISMSTFTNNSYNYMQFRTSSGGLEVGSVTIGATSGQNTSYWPYGNLNAEENSPFHTGTLDFSQLTEDASGTFMTQPEGAGGSGNDFIFGTSGGFFIVDMSNGSLLGLKKAATSAFDPAVAGTYSAIFYQKVNASTGQGNIETGTASLGQATIVITSQGGVTVTDSTGKTVTQATLIPIASASYLYGNGSDGKLGDPCNGMFTYRVTTASAQQDVFVTFVGNAVVFSTFSASLPWASGSSTYDYQYGVGLK